MKRSDFLGLLARHRADLPKAEELPLEEWIKLLGTHLQERAAAESREADKAEISEKKPLAAAETFDIKKVFLAFVERAREPVPQAMAAGPDRQTGVSVEEFVEQLWNILTGMALDHEYERKWVWVTQTHPTHMPMSEWMREFQRRTAWIAAR